MSLSVSECTYEGSVKTSVRMGRRGTGSITMSVNLCIMGRMSVRVLVRVTHSGHESLHICLPVAGGRMRESVRVSLSMGGRVIAREEDIKCRPRHPPAPTRLSFPCHSSWA